MILDSNYGGAWSKLLSFVSAFSFMSLLCVNNIASYRMFRCIALYLHDTYDIEIPTPYLLSDLSILKKIKKPVDMSPMSEIIQGIVNRHKVGYLLVFLYFVQTATLFIVTK